MSNRTVKENAKGIHTTFGEVLADGAMIELVSSSSRPNKPDLLLWKKGKATIASQVDHSGCVYEAPELDATLSRAVRLPARCCDYGSARELFVEIRDLVQHNVHLPDSESGLVACFAISTWIADRLTSAPVLTICGTNEQLGIELLRLLSCICRHPLMLAELTPSGFCALPMHLSLTLLLNQQRLKDTMQRLLRTSTHRGLHVLGNGGRVLDLFGPKAIVSGDVAWLEALGGEAIRISMSPSLVQPLALDEQLQDEIAHDFQPRLLMYRIRNLRKPSTARVDVSNYAFATRQLAGTLAQCFPENSKLAREVIQLLQSQDKEARVRRSYNVDCVIVEILWHAIHHEKQRQLSVAQLAKDVNALLRDRGESLQYSPEEIGWRLTALSIPRHTNSSGREILLGGDTRQNIHRLAKAYELECAQLAYTGCPNCLSVK